MKFQFKIQGYQTEAVEDTVNVFRGQPKRDPKHYRRDIGKIAKGSIFAEEEEAGYRNADVELDKKRLLDNIRGVQIQNQIVPSASLSDGHGVVNLDIEMETGTGKTYVYIKTMFELNKQYGWSKFIIVVPSIAIREGVAKSFRMLEDHFMEHYGKKARWFVYNSSNLNQLDQFSQDSGIIRPSMIQYMRSTPTTLTGNNSLSVFRCRASRSRTSKERADICILTVWCCRPSVRRKSGLN